MEKFDTVDDYIASFPNDTQAVLNKLRAKIKKLAPNAEESMNYGMPGYKLNKKPLVYFAGWRDHIGFYPTPNGMDGFEKELVPYKSGKGTAQFPLKKPIPYDLIEEIIKFRIEEVNKK